MKKCRHSLECLPPLQAEPAMVVQLLEGSPRERGVPGQWGRPAGGLRLRAYFGAVQRGRPQPAAAAGPPQPHHRRRGLPGPPPGDHGGQGPRQPA
eukprot:scaffold672492_cov38-Prasinocladus_malaysianus.AAC.1